MTEVNGQAFEEGDIVRFERAPLPQNCEQEYRITAITPAGIHVSAGGFDYQFAEDIAARLGITHATPDRTTEQ